MVEQYLKLQCYWSGEGGIWKLNKRNMSYGWMAVLPTKMIGRWWMMVEGGWGGQGGPSIPNTKKNE